MLCFHKWYLPRKALDRQLLKTDQARRRKEKDQQGKIQTAVASSAEVKPFLNSPGSMDLPRRATCPTFPSCSASPSLLVSPRGKRTIEGKAASHGSMKHLTTGKHRNHTLSFSWSHALAVTLMLSRGLPKDQDDTCGTCDITTEKPELPKMEEVSCTKT